MNKLAQLIFLLPILLSMSGSVLAGEPIGRALKHFAESKKWSDATGKFKIEGSLKYADTKEVHITRSDGKLIKIELEKLSDFDQKFVTMFLRIESAMNSDSPFVPIETSNSPEVPSKSDRPKKLEMALGNQPWKPTSSSPSAKRVYEQQKFVTNILVQYKNFFRISDSKAGGFAIGTTRGGSDSGSQMAFIHPQGFIPIVRSKEPWKLLSVSPDGSRVAAALETASGRSQIGIFQVTQDAIELETQFPTKSPVTYLGFSTRDRLVSIEHSRTISVWNLEDLQSPKVELEGSSFASQSAALSPDGRLLAVTTGFGHIVLDLIQNTKIGELGRGNQIREGRLQFSPDGQMLAAWQPMQVFIYSLTSGKEIARVPVTESNMSATFGWLGDHLIVGQTLYDYRRSIPLWSFKTDSAISVESDGERLIYAYGEQLLNLSVISVPYKDIEKQSAGLTAEKMYAIRPGDSVSVDYFIDTAMQEDKDKIRQVIEQKVNSLGWKLAAKSSNKIVIRLKEGEPAKAEYSQRASIGGLSRMFNQQGPMDLVNYKPWDHQISITVGGKKVFEAAHTVTAPSSLPSRPSESTQSAMDRFCKPTASYFGELPICNSLVWPQYQGGVGKSVINESGELAP
jgi:SLA1 homology domain 1, SHD1